MVTRKAKGKAANPDRELQVTIAPGQSAAQKLAEIAIDPIATAMGTADLFNQGTFGKLDLTDSYVAMLEQLKAAKKGDLSNQKTMLAAQAVALNAIFTEMARRAARNMGEYINTTQIYMRLALKAQAQCRSTIEALEGLTSGHVQTVKHVHVSEGGQAVIADEFHHHAGGKKNAEINNQPHAPGNGTAGPSPALSGPDTLGQGVPISSDTGKAAVQDARRQG